MFSPCVTLYIYLYLYVYFVYLYVCKFCLRLELILFFSEYLSNWVTKAVCLSSLLQYLRKIVLLVVNITSFKDLWRWFLVVIVHACKVYFYKTNNATQFLMPQGQKCAMRNWLSPFRLFSLIDSSVVIHVHLDMLFTILHILTTFSLTFTYGNFFSQIHIC